MRRRLPRKSSVGISLFPFLAVLICTMGALIVLLVIVVQQARVHANAVEAEPATRHDRAEIEARQMALEDAEWRSEVLAQQRQEIQQQLANKRLQLAHLEDHIRELEQRWQQLKSEVAELQRLRENRQTDEAVIAAELAALEQQLARAEKELAAARERAAQQKRTFTIIPYPGPNGTTRRPIYIECTERGIILRPENVVLRPEDFDGPLGPGNPLDAALRAIREYYMRNSGQAMSEEPYPLLIVRPDGVAGYGVAREAMSGWEDEFGYELVSDEVQLNYPPPDPALAALLQKAIADARSRQARLRAAMPAGPRAGGFVVSHSGGGVVPLGGDFGGPGKGVGAGFGGTGSGRGKSDVARKPSSGAGSSEQQSQQADVTGQSGSNGASLAVGANVGAPGGGAAPSMNMPTMAESRGADWALDGKTAHATGYRRPVRLVCEADRLVLTPEPGSNQAPQYFPFEQDPTRAIDQCVQAMQQRMKRWGLAPLGGYWSPQLKVVVAPDAEHRYEQLKYLLTDSGLEIMREAQ